MTVLVGYTVSTEGDAAFEAGLREAARRHEPLVLLNSPHKGALVDAALANEEQSRTLGERSQAAGVVLEIQQTPHTDDLVDTMLELADKVDASVIVIGLRRRSPVGKFLMGSTAQQLLLQANRPVLAVKPA
jgi:nucleotide-binding universal stress UspA family protein